MSGVQAIYSVNFSITNENRNTSASVILEFSICVDFSFKKITIKNSPLSQVPSSITLSILYLYSFSIISYWEEALTQNKINYQYKIGTFKNGRHPGNGIKLKHYEKGYCIDGGIPKSLWKVNYWKNYYKMATIKSSAEQNTNVVKSRFQSSNCGDFFFFFFFVLHFVFLSRSNTGFIIPKKKLKDE